MKKLLAVLCLSLIIISNAFAAEYGGVTASPYLNLGVSARACGMGEAYTAVVDNVDAGWWNPGALVKVQNPQFSLMHNQNFGGTTYEYLAVGFPAEQLGIDIWGTIGITVLLVRVEDVNVTKEDATTGAYSLDEEEKQETYGAGGTVLGLTYSWQAAKMFSIGATLKLINQKIALEEGWIPALDLGILANTMLPGFDVGIVLQNMSFMQMNQVKDAPDAPLPLNLKFGLSYKLPRLFTDVEDPKDAFVVGLDGIMPLQPANMPFKINIGFEYTMNYSDILFKPRMGYRFNGNQFVSDLGAFAGCTFGFGISKNFEGTDLALDYAFIPYGILGNSHRVGMTISIGQPTPTPTPLALNPPKMIKLKTEVKKIWVMWSIDKDSKVKVAGYNVYMSYTPGGKYYKLTKTPIASPRYYLNVGPLKSGLRSYFVVTSVDAKGRESKYSKEISAVPK
jgi:hypothetical protein